MEDGALTAVGAEEQVVPVSKVKELETRIKQLERALGRKTLDNEILKEAIRVGREKKLISRQPLVGVEGFE
jgi:transposase